MKHLENVDAKFLEKYLRKGKRHSNFEKTVDIYAHLSFHIDGYEYQQQPENPYFRLLIDDRRPSESTTIKKYRRRIYTSKTKQTCFKVINSLKKIVKSQEWKIDYSKADTPRIIKESESLENYCEKNYPIFGSIENWFYSYGLKEILTDPNGAVVVLPKTFDVKSNEMFEPSAQYIHSQNVLDYKEGEYIVYKSNQKSEYTYNGETYIDNVFMIIDTKNVWCAKKQTNNFDYTIELVYTHNFGSLPAFLGGGLYSEINNDTPLFDSFLSPMLPSLDVTARESSDLDAEVVQHVYSQMWYMQGENCSSCEGVGKVKKAGKPVVCPDCKGEGVIQKSPYKDLVIKKGLFENGSIPTPPAGYINKPTEIVKLQDERIKNHLMDALSSINMEFLAQTPLNQSGKAKEVDKDELNNFVYGVAYHMIENVIKPIYKFTALWRYSQLIPSKENIKKLLPSIPVPERFDLLSDDMLLDNIKKAKDSEVDSIILSEMQTDYINKKFREMPYVRDKLIAVNDLNPFVGVTSEQLNELVLGGIISKKDAIKSIYINEFVDKAINTTKSFLELDFMKQVSIIDKFAEEKMKSSNVAIMPSDMDGLNELDAQGNEIETPVDVEAEAKAKLKGTVGGVQGIIQINQSVANGEMTEKSAELLLVEIYGFDPAIAGRLIDPPKMNKKDEIKKIVPTIDE